MDRTTAVRQFIVEEFAPDIDGDDLDPDYDLLDQGIIDSLGLLTVVVWIEDQFGVELDPGELEERDFHSVRAISSLIESSVQGANGGDGRQPCTKP